MVGVDGSQDVPYYKQQLSTVATYFNFINFDVESEKGAYDAGIRESIH
jgi:hypothetical protein